MSLAHVFLLVHIIRARARVRARARLLCCFVPVLC